ncbi:hypothetical protein M8C21_000201 [Ambrosia artemisiifolia]|uniref:Uncharacterized protein n=1 Tax=Ambrosia artemisiifolia TaxID=4212 RepID=A0AAD5GU36_AMBAR|nr:hypothetical protein M8C21_000201 [Ambrosia artemisiifolia]
MKSSLKMASLNFKALIGGVVLVVLLIVITFGIFIISGLTLRSDEIGAAGGSKSIFAKEDNYKTLLLVASQKTVSVLVAVVEQLGGVETL